MRVLLGLVALSHLAFSNAASVALGPSSISPSPSFAAATGAGPGVVIKIYAGNNLTPVSGSLVPANYLNEDASQNTPANNINANAQTLLNAQQYFLATSANTVIFQMTYDGQVAQAQYQYPGLGNNWLCDSCVTGTPTTSPGPASSNLPSAPTGTPPFALQPGGSCDWKYGPAVGTNTITGGYKGYMCASFTRTYTMTSMATGVNVFKVLVWSAAPVSVTHSMIVTKNAPPVQGDPQIYGLQGQDFQVHGIPDEIFNMITYPNLQVNARFVYLSSAECHDNFTACFAHPGTYIGEEGIRLGNDKIHVKAGSFKKGLTVSVNGQKVTSQQKVKLGSVNVVSHRRVVVSTPVMTLTISNSDKFLNQETSLHDQKLLSLGADRRVLADGEQFHPEVPLHGLQGQTWRNVEYPSGLEYEGSINDYHVVDGNLFGTEFVFNQYKL